MATFAASAGYHADSDDTSMSMSTSTSMNINTNMNTNANININTKPKPKTSTRNKDACLRESRVSVPANAKNDDDYNYDDDNDNGNGNDNDNDHDDDDKTVPEPVRVHKSSRDAGAYYDSQYGKKPFWWINTETAPRRDDPMEHEMRQSQHQRQFEFQHGDHRPLPKRWNDGSRSASDSDNDNDNDNDNGTRREEEYRDAKRSPSQATGFRRRTDRDRQRDGERGTHSTATRSAMPYDPNELKKELKSILEPPAIRRAHSSRSHSRSERSSLDGNGAERHRDLAFLYEAREKLVSRRERLEKERGELTEQLLRALEAGREKKALVRDRESALRSLEDDLGLSDPNLLCDRGLHKKAAKARACLVMGRRNHELARTELETLRRRNRALRSGTGPRTRTMTRTMTRSGVPTTW